MDCPEPELLGAYLERRLPPTEVQALESHLAGCPDCRAETGILRGHAGSLPSRPWLPALAAGVLIALGAWHMAYRPPSPVPPPPASAASPTFLRPSPDLLLEAREKPRGWALEGDGRLALAGGSRLRFREPREATLIGGSLWLDAGTPWRIGTPVGHVEIPPGAECALRLESSLTTAWLLLSAWAGEAPRLTVSCMTGIVTVHQGDKHRQVPVGRCLAVVGETVREIPMPPALLAWREGLYAERRYVGNEALQSLEVEGCEARPGSRGLLLRDLVRGGRLRLPEPPAGDYRIEVAFRAEKAGGDLGLASPVDGVYPYWVMPVRTGEERLRIERRGDRMLLTRSVGTETISRAAAGALQAKGSGPGLALWGASVEVLEVRVGAWTPEVAP